MRPVGVLVDAPEDRGQLRVEVAVQLCDELGDVVVRRHRVADRQGVAVDEQREGDRVLLPYAVVVEAGRGRREAEALERRVDVVEADVDARLDVDRRRRLARGVERRVLRARRGDRHAAAAGRNLQRRREVDRDLTGAGGCDLELAADDRDGDADPLDARVEDRVCDRRLQRRRERRRRRAPCTAARVSVPCPTAFSLTEIGIVTVNGTSNAGMLLVSVQYAFAAVTLEPPATTAPVLMFEPLVWWSKPIV